MSFAIRRLAPGDEAILALLAVEDADFDLDVRGVPGEPLSPQRARAYLANPAVLSWVAVDGETIVGHLQCLHLPLRHGDGEELLLYEIGVRSAWRRRGAGRALLAEMEAWMRAHHVPEVWVLGDNQGAVDFYRACEFAIEDEQPVYLTRRLTE